MKRTAKPLKLFSCAGDEPDYHLYAWAYTHDDARAYWRAYYEMEPQNDCQVDEIPLTPKPGAISWGKVRRVWKGPTVT